MKWIPTVLLFLGTSLQSFSQNYHAIHGSSYVASLNVNNNPASILNSPYAWDIALFGTQVKSISNAFTIYKYSLLSNPANSEYAVNNGQYARYSYINFNTNLLNARFALSRTKGLAFGINLRGYGHLDTDPYNYIDTIRDINNFLQINDNRTRYDGDFKSSSWIELYGTYSQTLWDDYRGRLNGGVTLKVSRGISGAFARFEDVTVQKDITPVRTNYLLQSGGVGYGYSSNFDRWQDEKSTSQNIQDFIRFTEGGASLDFGLEYLVKTQAVTSFNDEDDGYYEYEWKISLSLMDIGRSVYKYGTRSRIATNPVSNVTSISLEEKFRNLDDVDQFNDSLATLVNSFAAYNGRFNIIHPARMILNVDRYLVNDFYINGELSLNLSPLAGEKRLYVNELNLLTVTPRWETKRRGAYLPVQVTHGGKFWVGGAFRVGPVLFGVHNLANIFAKNKMQNGGGYLAIIIRSGKKNQPRDYDKVNCP